MTPPPPPAAQPIQYPREFGRLYPPMPVWLARQAREPILEPELPIVDTHFHLVDAPGFRYLASDWLDDLGTGHNVEATVYAEAQTHCRTDGPAMLRPVGEIEFLASRAEAELQGPYAKGGAAVAEVLDAHIAAGHGRFKGIRFPTAADPTPWMAHHPVPAGLMGSAAFREGAKALADKGLSFDAWAFFHQMHEVAALADALPQLNIIVNHCGGSLGYGPYADRHQEVAAEWGRQMSELAKRPNVSVKLGGTLLRVATYNYLNVPVPEDSRKLAEIIGPQIVGCIERFGVDRCMFEGNFPIEKAVTGYAVMWNAFKRITAHASAAEKAALYSGTAQRVYRLERKE